MHSIRDYADLVDEFRRNGELARAAHEARTTALDARLRQRDPAGYLALVRAHDAACKTAFPYDPAEIGRLIDLGNAKALAVAVAFLVADPWFHRSGYIKARLLRHVKRAPFMPVQARQLRMLLLQVVEGRDRREFRHYGRLASRISTPGLELELQARAGSSDQNIARRAGWMLATIRNSRPANATDSAM